MFFYSSRTKDKTSNSESFHSESVTSRGIPGCLSNVAKEIADSQLVQSKIFLAVIFIPKRTKRELPFLCYGGHFKKQTYIFSKLWLCSSKGAEKMYQALPSSLTSKILKSNRGNRKRQYAAWIGLSLIVYRGPKLTLRGKSVKQFT